MDIASAAVRFGDYAPAASLVQSLRPEGTRVTSQRATSFVVTFLDRLGKKVAWPGLPD